MVAVVELGVERALPVGEPAADFALQLLDGGCGGFGAISWRRPAGSGRRAAGFPRAVGRVAASVCSRVVSARRWTLSLSASRLGFVGEQAGPPDGLDAGGAWRSVGFEPDDALLKTFEMAADDDFADALDRLGGIEG